MLFFGAKIQRFFKITRKKVKKVLEIREISGSFGAVILISRAVPI
jgi:hypothetical protein